MSTYYLTKEEIAAVKKFAEDFAVPDEQIVEEDVDSLETDEQLRFRFTLANYDKYPEVQLMMDDVQKVIDEGNDLEQVSIEGLSEGAMQVFFSSIGARGVTAIMEASFDKVKNIEDRDAVGALSRIRHGLLKSNAEFFSPVRS